MSTPGAEFVEVFLQEASEHLQFLREYSGILQDPYPVPEDIQRLYISAHTLEGSSGSYGFPLFREVASKLSHIFQYAMNATIAPDATGPITEFISEGIAVLESDLLMISANGIENEEEIAAFKQRYSFAFEPLAPAPQPVENYVAPVNLHKKADLPLAAESHVKAEARPNLKREPAVQPGPAANVELRAQSDSAQPQPVPQPVVAAAPANPGSDLPDLEPDGDVPSEILEFFIPEAEEHLQIVQDCLLALEGSADPEIIHRLFRSMHTIKGSAAQVGLQRISHVAHRAEDLIGRVRDGELKPSQKIIDLCFEAVDVIKKFVYRQWPDETTLQATAKSLLSRLGALAPSEETDAPTATGQEVSANAASQPAQTKSETAPAQIKAPVEESSESEQEPEIITGLRSKEPAALPQSKSVRIAL